MLTCTADPKITPVRPLVRPIRPGGSLCPIRPLTAQAGSCTGHLLVLVCDAAVRFLLAADAAMEADGPMIAAPHVRRAQSILVEMMGAVDRNVAPDATDALTRLCQYLIDGLSEAIATGDVTRVREASRLLAGLRDAWAAATGASIGASVAPLRPPAPSLT